MRTLLLLIVSAFLISSCDNKKAAKKSPNAAPPAATASNDAGTSAAAPVFPSPLATRTRGDRHGGTTEWQAGAGIKVEDAHYREVYASGGSHFVAFKATITVADEDCLLDWRAELIATPTGRGPTVATISGLPALKANTSSIVSGVVALSTEELAQVGSASAGYWTLCGDAIPRPSAFDIDITESSTEQIRFGNAFDLHHTVVHLRGPAETTPKARCYFDIVAEDRDADGYTLNRDFASFSLATSSSSLARIRRTSFEGGRESDYVGAVASKTTYLRDVFCEGPWTAPTGKPEGIEITDLELRPFTDPPSTAEQFVRASFGHQATLHNLMGKDCSFRVRYRILDKDGVAMNKAPILSETLHLPKGARRAYVSKDQRLYVWKDQAEEVGSLVVEKAEPIDACKSYRAKLAVGASTQ